MVAATDSEGTKGFSGKKVSKPLMEKKRRARINRCLDQLKTLLETCYSNNIRKRKLEKADILELTVRHLRHLQKSRGGSTTHADCSDYQAGFRSCLAGVNQYLLMTGTGGSNRSDMLAQLSSRCVHPDTRCEYFSTADSDPRTGRSADDSAQKLSAGILLQTTPVAMSSGSRVETTTKKKHRIALKTTQLPGKVCQTLPRTPVGVAATRNRQENGSAVDTPRDCTSTNGQHNDQYVMICSDSYWRPW